MEIGSKFVGDVKDLSPEGTGVVEHPSGMIFFVSGVWPGEVGEFIITERNKNFGMAKLVTLQSTHSDRREAECKHHGFGPTDCSNCAWQFISYSGQLEAKQSRVHKRLASYISLDRIAPIWGAPEEFGYRNRTQFKTDGKSIGYVNNTSGKLAAIDDCPVLNKKNRNSLRQLKRRLPEIMWAPDTGWTTLDLDDAISAEKVSINQRRHFLQVILHKTENFSNGWRRVSRSLNLRPVMYYFLVRGDFTRFCCANATILLSSLGTRHELSEKLRNPA